MKEIVSIFEADLGTDTVLHQVNEGDRGKGDSAPGVLQILFASLLAHNDYFSLGAIVERLLPGPASGTSKGDGANGIFFVRRVLRHIGPGFNSTAGDISLRASCSSMEQKYTWCSSPSFIENKRRIPGRLPSLTNKWSLRGSS